MMSTSPRRTGLRLATSSAIALSTALATAVVVLPAPAFGQALPSIGTAGNDGGAALDTSVANTLGINIGTQNRIINWESYNVQAGNTVNYTSGDANPYSVLNRVIMPGTQSTINGTVTASNNIAVWLVNQAGIFFGPSGTFSGGRLVLSTLDLGGGYTDADFLAGTGTVRFAGNSTAAINLQGGGTPLQVIGTNGSFVAIGQDITVSKTVTATGGDVAFIAARDVSFPVGLGSPLSITVNQGTTLATAKVDSSGAITGANVRLVGASQGGAIANLLNVGGGSLTATAVGGAVVLATGTVAGQNVTVSSPAATDDIRLVDAVNPGAGRDLIINSTRDVSVTAATGIPVSGITAARDLSLNQTGGALTFDPNALGAATWGRDISLTATGTVDVSSLLPFTSPGAINITSTTGNIVSNNATVASLSAGTDINLSAAAGNVNFSSLVTGATAQNISITAQDFSLANINASLDLSLTDTLAGLAFNPASFGWGRDINLTATNGGGVLVTANLLSPGAARITAAGDIQANSIATTNGAIALTANGNVLGNPGTMTLNAGGALGDVSVIANQANLANVTASNSIGIRAGGNLSGATFDAGEDIAIDGGGAVNVTTLTADDDINVQAAGLVTLGTVGTDGSGPDTRTVNIGATPITFTASAANNANISLASTGNNLVITTSAKTEGPAGGSITLGAAGTIDARTLNSAQNITLGATVQTAGAIDYTAGGEIVGDSLISSGGGITLSAGTNVRGNTVPGMGIGAAAAPNSDISVTATAGSASLGIVNASRDVIISGTAVNAPTITAVRDIAITGPVSVAGAVNYTANTGSIKADSITTANGAVALLAATDVTGNTVAKMNIDANGAAADAGIIATAGQAQLGTVTADRALIIQAGTALDITSGNAFGISATAGTTAALGNLTATSSIGARSVGNMTGGTIDAGVDLALAVTGAGNTVNLANLRAGDDIDVTASGGITLTQALARGTGADTSAIDLTTSPPSVLAGETAGHTGSNIRLTSSTGGVTINGSATTQGGTGADIVIRAATSVSAGPATLTSAKSLGIIAGTDLSAGTLAASEDLRVEAGGNATLTSASAGDDLTALVGATLRIDTGVTTNTGTGIDTRAIDFAAPTGFTAGDGLLPGTSIRTTSTNLQVDSLTSAVGNIALTATGGGNVSGIAGAPSSGGPLAGFGRADLTVSGVDGMINVITGAAGTAQLGTVIAGTGAGNVAGNQLTVTAGTVDLQTGTVRDGRTALTSVTGDIGVAGSLTGRGNVTLNSAANLRIADHVAGVSGFVRSTDGNVEIDAARSVIGYVGSNTMTTAAGIDGLAADGAITITGTGDLRVDSIVAAGNVGITIDGSLTGTAPVGGERGAGLTGGAVFANGTADIDAGNTAPDLMRLNRVEAGGNVIIDATNIAIGTLRTPGVSTLTGGNSYIGVRSSPGNLTLAFNGARANVNAASLTSDDVIETGFGKTAIASNGGAITATIGDNAQLSTVNAANNVAITAQGLTATGLVRSTTGGVSLTASQGTLQTAAVTAGTTAAITKQAGLLANQALGDEMRLAGAVTAAGDATVLSNTHARVVSVTSTTGNVSTTATLGDVSGLSITPATDGRLLADFGRATLTASAADRTVTANAASGTVQLGTVTAGTGVSVLAGNQILSGARQIDITSATAANGNLSLTSTAGETRLATGSAAGNGTILASTNARVGSLTSTAGDVSVTATAGDVSGAELDVLATDGRLLTGFDRANLTAGTANRTVAVSAVAGNAQLGAVNAGTGLGTLAGNQITVGARAIDVTSATALNGHLSVISTAGETRLATGSAGSNAVVTGATNIRIGSLTARTGTVAARALGGDLSGLARTPVATDGRPLTGFDRADLTASALGQTILATATGTAQLGTLNAGTGLTLNPGAQITATGASVDLTSATAANGGLTVTASAGDAIVASGTSGNTADVTASANVRIGSLTSRALDARATATNGDVTGLALVPGFGAANLSAGGAGGVFVTANNGMAQLGTLTGAMSINATAQALSVNTATTTAANMNLTATAGSLVLGTGTIGGSATLNKTGATGEVDVTTLSAGNFNGSTGSATITSSTNIRAGSITARGANVSLIAADGEVTGRGAGGRATLLAIQALDGGGTAIGGTDRSVIVTTGRLARLGTVAAGDGITITAGDSGVATRDGGIDALSIVSTRGNATLRTFNNDAGSTSNGLRADVVVSGSTALLEASGSNSGSITSDSMVAGNIALHTTPGSNGSISVASVVATGSIAARSANLLTGTTFNAGKDIAATAAQALTLGTVTGGDDVDLTGATVSLGTARATGAGASDSAIDLSLMPAPFVGAEVPAKPNANLSITSTSGAVSVTGDLSAQRNITIATGGATTLAGNLTAGAPVVPAGPVIAGDLSVNSGGVLTLGSADPRAISATGAVGLTAAGNIVQGAGPLAIRSNADQIGAEGLTVTATAGIIALGNTAFVGGSVANRESVVTLDAAGGTVAFNTVDAQGLTIRAGGQVTANGAIVAGNPTRPADGVPATIDIQTTAGGISLTSATATEAGHDITLIAPGAISAATLTAARNIGVTGGTGNIATATATAGSLSVTGGTGAAIVGTGTAGAGIIVMGTSATATTLGAGGALLVRATAGDASLGTGTAGGTGTVSATGAAGVGSLTAAGAVNVSAGTSATATALNSTGAAATVTGGSVNVGTARAATALALDATAGNLTLTEGTAGTTGFTQSTGVTTVGTLTASGDATVRGATSAAATTVTSTSGIVLVEATAGGASLGTGTAGTFGVVRGTTSASATNLTAGSGLLVNASAGDASLGTGMANGGTGTVSGTGTATAASLTASGTASLAAGTTATAGTMSSTGADVQVSGATTNVGTAIAATSLTVSAGAGNATLGTGVAGGAGTVQASGAANVTSLTSGGTATLAAGTAATAGTIRSTGADVVVNGETVNLTTAQAATSLSATATGGNLTIDRGIAGTTGLLRTTGGNGDVIVTTSLETGGAATVSSVSDARLALVRGSSVTVTAANGEVTGVDPATATNLTATTSAVDVTNGLISRLGTIAGNGVTVSSGTVVANDVNAGTGALRLTATNGPLSLTTGNAGTTATVQASGAATVARLTAGTDATIRGATADVTSATATAGNLLVEATAGNATIGTAQAGTALSARARGGDLTLTQGTAGGTAFVEASGLATVQTLTAGTDATITGASIDATTATATTGALLLNATAGSASLGTGVAGGNGIVAATGNADVGTLTAGGDVLLIAGGAATADTIRSIGANVFAESATVAIDTAIAATGLSIRATGGDLSLVEGIAGTFAVVEATGLATVQTLTAGTDARIRGANVDATTATAATGVLMVDATAGDVSLGTGTAGGTGTVQATGGAALTTLTAAGTATLTAGTAATAGTVRSTGADVSITGATATVGTAEAATALEMVASGGDLTLDRGTAGTTGRLRTTGGNGNVIVTTSLETGGAATVETVGDARLALVRAATGDITVTAPGGEVTGIGAAGANLTATAGAVNVTNGLLSRLEAVAGNGVTVASGTVVANDLNAGTGALSLTATNGPLSLVTGAAGTTALVQASGAATVGTLTAGTDATIRAANVNATTATATGGALLVDATAGNATLGTGTAGGTGTVRATGSVGIGSLVVAGTATLAAGTAGTATTIRSTGADVVATGASLDLGTADARTTLTATASNGALTLGTGTAGGTGTLRTTGGGANGDVSVTTSLTTGGAATIASVSDARLASVTAATGNVQVTAASGEVTGVGAGNANLVATAGAVNVEGGTLARLGTVGAAGTTGVTVTADTIAATNVNSGTGALSLVADTGGVTLGTGRSGTTSLIDARQTATISTSLTAGTSARINAANAEIGGPVAAATRIDVVNTGTGNPFVLGTATGTGFQLSETEVNRLNAPELTLDARSNNIAIGALSFDADTGGNRVDLLGLGRIDVTGTVAAPGGAATRVIRFGGSATASDKASVIRVAALANGGGGRLLMPNAALELRGVKIGVGQDGRFLESLGLTPGGAPLSVNQVGVDFIGNPQSTLYYSGNFGGAPYNPIGQTLVSANSLTVRTTDYALFQNTGTVGQTTGAVIDARTTNPKVPALTVSGPNPPDAGGFAIFGTFNGFEGSAAALLGATDISIIAVDGTRTRVNGCIVGSGGGGCLSNSIVQPVVNVFDSSRSDVLKTSSDFEAPFDPVVGTNNESLFGDVGTFGLEDIPLTSESEPATEECGGPDKAPCAANEGQK